MPTPLRLPRFLLLAALLAPMAAVAQIPGLAKAEAEPVAESKAPSSVALADIPSQADTDERRLRDMHFGADGDGRRAALEKELKDIEGSLARLEANYRPEELGVLPIRRLESLSRHWDFVAKRLSGWQSELQAQIKPLSEDAAALAEMRRVWTATRTASDGLVASPLLLRIDLLLAQIDAANTDVSGPLTRYLELDRRAATLDARIKQGIAGITAIIERIDRNLTRLDSQPLNVALARRDRGRGVGAALLERGFDIETGFSSDFDKHSRLSNNIFRVIALLLLPVFFWLSRQAKRKIAEGAVPDAYRSALTRPFSAWLLVVTMGVLLLEVNGPMIRLQLWLLLAWIPVMRLMPKRVYALVGPWMYLSAIFYALNLASLLLTPEPLLFRLVVLLNGVLMLATLLWVLYRSSTAIKARSAKHLLAIRVLLALGIALLAVAIVANLIGNVSLAAMLTDATLNSSYIGMFIFAVGTVLTAFARLAFSRSTARLRRESQHAGTLFDVGGRLFSMALLLFWAIAALNLFRVMRPLMDALKSVSSFTLAAGNLSISVGGIVLFCVSVYLSFWLARTIRSVLAEDVLPNMSLPRGVANSVSTMSYYLLLMAGLMVALSAAGFQLSQLAIVLGALSVGIGFGLQTVVNNFVSGLILMIERPVQPGDTVELSGTVGRVRDIGMRATTLTTFEGADVIVPNGMLLSEKMINWTLSSDKRRIDIPVGVAYGNDPERILALLAQVADATPGVSRNPAPTVLFTGFGQSSLDFSVRAWTDSFDDSVFVRSRMAVGIHAALKQAGIEIPFPQRDLHVKSLPSGMPAPASGEPT